MRLQRARHLPFPLTVTAADGDTEHHEVENRPLVFALAEDDGSQLNSAVQRANTRTSAGIFFLLLTTERGEQSNAFIEKTATNTIGSLRD